jgi:starvation-inducible DNA-binding protein
VSVWLDDISRDRLRTGNLQELVDGYEPDPVTQDMLIGQAAQLEQFHWFVRAHLESPSGSLVTAGASTEQQAAARARQ